MGPNSFSAQKLPQRNPTPNRLFNAAGSISTTVHETRDNHPAAQEEITARDVSARLDLFISKYNASNEIIQKDIATLTKGAELTREQVLALSSSVEQKFATVQSQLEAVKSEMVTMHSDTRALLSQILNGMTQTSAAPAAPP